MAKKSIKRDYQPDTCYLYQLYLICNKELAFNTCKCNIFEKPKLKLNKITKKIYSRVYNSNNTKTLSQL